MFIILESVGDFVHYHEIVGDYITKVQGNHHGASGSYPNIPKRILDGQASGFLVIQFQQGIRLGGSAGFGLDFFKILKNAPLVDFFTVLGHIQFPLAGFFIVIGQLDFIIGLIINAGFITEIFTGFFINQKIKFHGIDVFQGQLSNIIIKNKQLFGIHQGFIQSILNHIKQGLVFLHDGFNGVPGIFHITKVQLEISCQPFQKIGSLQPFFCQSVLVLQVSQLIKSHNINGGAFVPLLLEHKPIKHGGSVNRQLHRITFLEV